MLVVEVEAEPLGVVVLDDLGEEVDVAGELANVVRVRLDEVLLEEMRDLGNYIRTQLSTWRIKANLHFYKSSSEATD